MNDLPKRRKVRVMRIRRAFELLARYYVNITEARFLLDIDNPHAHKEFEAMQTMAKQLWTVMPEELEKVIQAEMDRNEGTNGKKKAADDVLWSYMTVRAMIDDPEEPGYFFITTLLSSEYVAELANKVYTVASGNGLVPTGIDFDVNNAVVYPIVSEDVDAATATPPYVFFSDQPPNGKSGGKRMDRGQLHIVLYGVSDWTQAGVDVLANDFDIYDSTYSLKLLDLMRHFYIDPRSIEDR